jgi:hypothetical protein
MVILPLAVAVEFITEAQQEMVELAAVQVHHLLIQMQLVFQQKIILAVAAVVVL